MSRVEPACFGSQIQQFGSAAALALELKHIVCCGGRYSATDPGAVQSGIDSLVRVLATCHIERGCLQMTKVFERSSAKRSILGQNTLASVLHGVWLLALMVAFPAVLRLIPISALASLLVYTGFKPVNIGQIKICTIYSRG